MKKSTHFDGSYPAIFRSPNLAFIAGIAITLNLAIHFGVREKTWLEKFFDIFTGGGLGAVAGVIVCVVCGGFGVVSGTISFGVGMLGLILSGGVAGLGLGSLFHIIFNADDYVYNWPLIVFLTLVGALLSVYLANVVNNATARSKRYIYDLRRESFRRWP